MFRTKAETGKGAPLIGAVATGKESQNPKGSLCHLALQAAAREEKFFFFLCGFNLFLHALVDLRLCAKMPPRTQVFPTFVLGG